MENNEPVVPAPAACESDWEYGAERFAAITWSFVTEGGDERAHGAVTRFGYLDALERLRGADIELQQLAESAWKVWRKHLDQIEGDDRVNAHKRWLRALQRLDAHVLIPSDPLWPTALNDLGESTPIALWVRGTRAKMNELLGERAPESISIVGSRAASGKGIRIATDFAFDLAADHIVASGGAFGIDAAAHKGALLAGGPTVIFSAAGVDRVYPSSHTELFQQVRTGGGLVISEHPLGAAPHAHRFLLRNRLIAAFSRATLVVEAPVRSGALSTARAALAIGRNVGAVPGAIDSPNSLGCHELIRNGGTLIASVAHLRELAAPIGIQLSLAEDTPDFFNPAPSELGERGVRVYDAVPKRVPAETARIAKIAGVTPREARAELGKMALFGLVAQRNGRWVKASPASKL